MDHTPRQLFALIRAGRREEVLQSNTPWMCVSCYNCIVRCHQQIQITDVMYGLKTLAVRSRQYRDSTPADFSRTFIGMVEMFGRSFEVGLAGVHYLLHFPLRLPGIVPVTLNMLSKSRLGVVPTRIKNMAQLKAILARAKEMEAAQ